tara:strand:- start:11211 stop:12047 length:837 start_codon:yes stop_codon:yes gene_type:complete
MATKDVLNLDIPIIEASLLEQPQMECPVVHHFGPGIYIREVRLPAGALAVGHTQRHRHMNIMLTGKVAMITNDGVNIVQAPLIFVGEPGKKMGYVIEDCVWQNIYATEETDIEKLEAYYLKKSDAWSNSNEAKFLAAMGAHTADRLDFEAVLSELNVTAETVREQSCNELDMMELPGPWTTKVSVRPSPIEGRGLFSSFFAAEGEVVSLARMNGKRTIAGRYVNHSLNPNCRYVKNSRGDINLVAKQNIDGCMGGDFGTELTVDYRQAVAENLKDNSL